MRDIFILGIFAWAAFKAFKQPHIGMMLMLWLTHMNPHRLAPWAITYSLPLYAGAFAVTALAFLFSPNKDPFPRYGLNILMLVFLVWGALCTVVALEPQWATQELVRFFKIQIGVVLFLLLMQGKQKIFLSVWVITLSLAFYGIKGGWFALITGGAYRVWGPPDSFVEGNNELALALLMTIPLLFFLFMHNKNKWLKRALVISIGLCLLAVIASYSRGAFLAMIVTGFFLWTKSKYKVPLAVLGIVGVLALIPFIPEQWYERMDTIQNYEQDRSANGRINAWYVAVNVANDRITAGGFGHWGPVSFAMYAPNPEMIHDAHSIYFEVLGELGYPGLLIYLAILWQWWRLASRNIKLAKDDSELAWCADLSKMIQVSQMAYMSGGAFLGLAYWNMPYHLMTIIILVNIYLTKTLQQREQQGRENPAHPLSSGNVAVSKWT